MTLDLSLLANLDLNSNFNLNPFTHPARVLGCDLEFELKLKFAAA